MFKSVSIVMVMIGTVTQVFPVRGGDDFDGTLRVAGSTTLLPIVADAASRFMEKYETWDKVQPTFPKKTILIYVTGGGSGFGIKSAMDGSAHIGTSSRYLKDEEKQKLGDHQQFLLSMDCVAFASHKESALSKAKNDLTRAEVVKILSGEAKTWKDVDPALPADPIVLLMRDAAGGSTEILQKMILKEKTFSPHAIQVPSQGANIKKCETTPNAFAYFSSVVALRSDGVKTFSYEGVEPTNENVLSGRYPLVRPLLLIVKGQPNAYVKAFIDYLLGEGQAVVEEHGYVPVKVVSQ
jgi:phosphate transport system substrate-binding protein